MAAWAKQNSHLTAAVARNGMLEASWNDGFHADFHYIWLRDNCRCSECGDPAIGRRKLRLTDIDLDISPKHLATENNNLTIEWDGGHNSVFAGDWLRAFTYSSEERKSRAFKPTLWCDNFWQNPPEIDYESVLQDSRSFLDMLHAVRDFGLCFIRHSPAVSGTLEALAQKIGPIQESNFGRVQDLVLDNSKRSIANSFEALKLHTDEPYRASPPGLLMFHCIEIDQDGAGTSIFLDGFEAAQTLREEDPEGFQVLCESPLAFRRHFADDVDLVAEFPLISVDEFNNIMGVRINDRVAAPLSITSQQVPIFYRALQRLLTLCEDPDRILQRVLSPGDIAIFDNHRILHGRTELTLSGRRWLQWVQVERGDFHSTMRIASDKLNCSRETTALLRGAYG